jgi:hypothetical protein
VVGKGPYGSTAVGGANADVTIDAAGGTVHHGALAVSAAATAPHVQFSSNARFEGDTEVNVTSAGIAASPPVAVAVPATDPPIAPVGSAPVVPPDPAPASIALPAASPASAPVGNAPVVPPKAPPPLAGWHHADSLTWFSALLHPQHGGAIRGAVATAHPMGWGHGGVTQGTGQKQPMQQWSLLELLGFYSADTGSTAPPEPPPKTRRPFPLGP